MIFQDIYRWTVLAILASGFGIIGLVSGLGFAVLVVRTLKEEAHLEERFGKNTAATCGAPADSCPGCDLESTPGGGVGRA